MTGKGSVAFPDPTARTLNTTNHTTTRPPLPVLNPCIHTSVQLSINDRRLDDLRQESLEDLTDIQDTPIFSTDSRLLAEQHNYPHCKNYFHTHIKSLLLDNICKKVLYFDKCLSSGNAGYQDTGKARQGSHETNERIRRAATGRITVPRHVVCRGRCPSMHGHAPLFLVRRPWLVLPVLIVLLIAISVSPSAFAATVSGVAEAKVIRIAYLTRQERPRTPVTFLEPVLTDEGVQGARPGCCGQQLHRPLHRSEL